MGLFGFFEKKSKDDRILNVLNLMKQNINLEFTKLEKEEITMDNLKRIVSPYIFKISSLTKLISDDRKLEFNKNLNNLNMVVLNGRFKTVEQFEDAIFEIFDNLIEISNNK